MQLSTAGTLLIPLLSLLYFQHAAMGMLYFPFHTFLLLLVCIFAPVEEAIVVASADCPSYSLSALQNFTDLCPHGDIQVPSAQLLICCEEIYGAAMFALAKYANVTGRMFFPNPQAQQCVDMYKHYLISSHHLSPNFFQRDCPLLASRITATPNSCKFGYVNELRRIVDLSNISVACGQLRIGDGGCQSCQTQLFNVINRLVNYTGGDVALCGTAVAVAVTSLNPSLPAFQTFYQCGLEILSTGPLSEYFNKSGIITLPPATVSSGDFAAEPLSKSSVILVITFAALIVLVCLTLACLFTVRTRGSDCVFKHPFTASVGTLLSSESSNVTVLPTEGFYIFHLKELTRATNNFSDALVVGQGSAGTVYLGNLPSGQLVAVKRILKEKKVETFNKEVELLSRIRHPNLTALLGYCQSKFVHLLVYEYMSHGDLGKKLLDQNATVLTWEQRIKIATDCAKGLMYLHECAEGPIIHRDIKPNNILLSENLEAKLSDFGLSKCLEIEASHVSTEIKGTTGYVDPEYLILGQLTEASDVYSFGVVLLQLLSGRKAIDGDSQHSRSLVQLAIMVMSHELDFQEFIDPRLQGVYPLPAFQKMAEVAHCCVQPRSYDRPSISEVLDGLDLAMRLGNLHSPKST